MVLKKGYPSWGLTVAVGIIEGEEVQCPYVCLKPFGVESSSGGWAFRGVVLSSVGSLWCLASVIRVLGVILV